MKDLVYVSYRGGYDRIMVIYRVFQKLHYVASVKSW
jgi:hypothetical protein